MSTHNTPDTFRYTHHKDAYRHTYIHTYMQQYHNYMQYTQLYTDVHHSLMSTYNTQYILIHTTHTAVPHLHITHLCMHSNIHTLHTHNSPMTTSHLLITHITYTYSAHTSHSAYNFPPGSSGLQGSCNHTLGWERKRLCVLGRAEAAAASFWIGARRFLAPGDEGQAKPGMEGEGARCQQSLPPFQGIAS